MTRFTVRQLLEDRLALNTGAEMIDALQISRHWRVKKKMKKKIFERISQMVSYGAILDNTIISKMTGKGKILIFDDYFSFFATFCKIVHVISNS